MKYWALLLPLLLLPTAQAAVTLTVQDSVGNYSPLQHLAGNVKLNFDVLVPQSATLFASVNDQFAAQVSMQTYVDPPASYSFPTYPFDYNITAQGRNLFSTFPAQNFTYTVKANGTCGGYSCQGAACLSGCPPDYCPPGTSFPCYWEASYTGNSCSGQSCSVKGNDGLKHIYDASQSISVPFYNNNNTVWTITAVSNPQVTLTTTLACGTPFPKYYQTHLVSQDGWVRRTLLGNEFQPISGTADKQAYIESFSTGSLYQRTDYNGGPGGIYKNGVYQTFGQGSGAPGDSGAIWNGTSGYIRVYNYDATAVYTITYLPPNGPIVCAFTSSKQSNSDEWSRGYVVQGGTTDYLHPYARAFTTSELSSLLAPPACPKGSEECIQNTTGYNAYDVVDPKNAVSVTWDDPLKTVHGFTTLTTLTQLYSVSVPLLSFPGLLAPVNKGPFTIGIQLLSGGAVLASSGAPLNVCTDKDGDGVCPEAGDCNDADASISPAVTETCDGKDNNCNGQVDEGFSSPGSQIGEECGIGACASTYVCTPDGKGVACNSKVQPGQLPEYCDDHVDNDCDGVVDEQFELIGGQQKIACTCKDGDTRSCGSGAGACGEKYQVCSKGAWGECKSQFSPSAEICNGLDDNCDGVIDNVNGGSSIDTSACQCYTGAAPRLETCNQVDDDCDGQIDEGVSCCSDGQTATCGLSVGVCSPGTKTCVGHNWGPCVGGVQPSREVCFNDRDDNCDGTRDEGCSTLQLTCSNGLKDTVEEGIDCGGSCPNGCDSFPLILIGGVVIIIIGVIGFLQFVALKS